VFGNSAAGLFAANQFIWGNVVKPFDTYCLGDLVGVSCSAFQEFNQVSEYFDAASGSWRSDFAARDFLSP